MKREQRNTLESRGEHRAWRLVWLSIITVLLVSTGCDHVQTRNTTGQDRADTPDTRRKQARLLAGYGLDFETRQLARENLEVGDITREELIWLANCGSGLWNPIKLQQLHRRNPHDVLPVQGLVKHALRSRDHAALQRLLSIQDVDNLPLAMLRYQHGQQSDSRLQTRLLTRVEPCHPDAWAFWAHVATLKNANELAVHALINAVQLDRFNPRHVYALAESTKGCCPAFSFELLQLWQQLQKLESNVADVISNAQDQSAMRVICDTLNDIGRIPESTQWARLALQIEPDLTWARTQILAWHRMAKSANDANGEGWQHPIDRLPEQFQRHIEMSDYRTLIKSQPLAAKQAANAVCFEDVSAKSNLRFRYNNGNQTGQVGLRMHEWTGGGVGVLDIDGDLYPDLYLTQGGTLANKVDNALSDQVFRNLRGDSFVSVSNHAQIFQSGFGQGIAIGDVNNDGFDDALIANIGRNRLLLNQGDGTFVESSVLFEDTWTTSVAIADLNADGCADLYEANYLKGDDVFEQRCNHDGRQRVCGPLDFQAEPDRLWLSTGDGIFADASALIADHIQGGRSMGVLIGGLSGRSGNDVLVANDETANTLLHFSAGQVDDAALISGVAFNALGQSQGCMGIASADVNGNGLLDLFVTNYYAESNTLYAQVQKGTWMDRSISAGFAEASIPMLGFGTQFADFDVDGDADLVVANGHLDNFTHLNHPWKMVPQLFTNDGKGHFTLLALRDDYFTTPQLGRSLATLDWNMDHRPDFCVTALDTPVRLLQNDSTPTRDAVTVKLIGSRADRAAIGTQAQLQYGKAEQHRWLTSGHGYQCSNERTLHFAIPEEVDKAKIVIDWPDGNVQAMYIEPTANRIVVVEGRSIAVAIPR